MPRVNGTTTERGYGQAHTRARLTYLAVLEQNPGMRCADPACETPWLLLHYEDRARIDLGHTPDRTAYRGLEHRACNRRDGARRGNQARRYTPPPTSRNW